MKQLKKIFTCGVIGVSLITFNPNIARSQSAAERQSYQCAGFAIGALIQGNADLIPPECLDNQYQPDNYYPQDNYYGEPNYYPQDIDAYIRQQNRRARQIERQAEWLNTPDPVCLSCSN